MLIFFLIAGLSMSLGWAAYQAATPEEPLSRYVPSGALLYLQAKDFSSLQADWNKSPQKQSWMGSSNYEVFSRSRLLLRLKDAGKQFSAAAGLPPDMNFLSQVAGNESAFALYDIGKLQFIYITRLPSANAMQNQLWQTRAKFETRNAGGTTFYLSTRPRIAARSRVRGQRRSPASCHAGRFDGGRSAIDGRRRSRDRVRSVVCAVGGRRRSRWRSPHGAEPRQNCAQPLFPFLLGTAEYQRHETVHCSDF